MRKMIALLVAALLILMIVGPTSAAPSRDNNPNVFTYDIDCGTVEFTVTAYKTAGWDTVFESGDTPWRLLGYTVHWLIPTPGFFTHDPPPGLVASGHLYGPCDIDPVEDLGWWITDAWFVLPRP